MEEIELTIDEIYAIYGEEVPTDIPDAVEIEDAESVYN